MNFKCINHHNSKIESWNEKMVYFRDCSNCIEMNIQSRSSIDVIIGTTKYGNYVCIPNFEVGCYLSSFDDVFCNKLGAYLVDITIGRQYKIILKKNNIPIRKFHDMRHTFATRLFELGEEPKTVQELLGHSTV